MENEIEIIDSTNDTQEETTETTLTVDDYNKLLEEKKALEEANKKLYARVKKSSENKPLVNNQPTQDNSQVTQELARLKLRVEHGISDPEAIDFIMKNGGEKALENPYIKGTVDAMVSQKTTEKAVVSEESGYSTMDKKYSNDELKNMSSDDLEKLLPHA
ncbi:MAG: hypothetical protein ACR2IQ_02570 [Minisyncoccia bacterium]